MTAGRPSPDRNHLLASLPPAELRRFSADLEPVELIAGQVVHAPGQAVAQVLFPCSGVVSLNYPLADGTSLAVALVGREGMAGISIFMGGGASSEGCTVQTSGTGFRVAAGVIRRELRHSGQLQALGLRFIQALTTQMAQTAVCNRHHSLDQQVCRWLLLSLDRLDGCELAMTHEMIAQMLGVRREGVSASAARLQEAGAISYSRGRILVLDRSALEARSCECYAVVRAEYARLLPVVDGTRRTLRAV